MPFAKNEEEFWVKKPKERPEHVPDAAINDRYSRGEGRIVIETNREKLPGFVNMLRNNNYMDLRPFYQRRPRWDHQKQSLLIESFIMNIPVPPVFLYERDFNSYEVMDGQQRITALRDFFEGKFELEGLKEWPEINGRTYATLPDKIRAGLDRRSISSIVLLKESTTDEDDASNLRETVFERLNTGGVKLSRQEIRNALYQGRFNDLLHRLSRLPTFRKAWGLPEYVENEIDITPGLLEIPMYQKMEDVEMVLRFFALRHANEYRSGMQGFLDIFIRKSMILSADDVNFLDHHFRSTLSLAASIYGEKIFETFDPATGEWEGRPHKAFSDAVLVGLSEVLDHSEAIKAKATEIVSATKQLFAENPDGTFTGRKNTRDDIETRIRLYKEMIQRVAT